MKNSDWDNFLRIVDVVFNRGSEIIHLLEDNLVDDALILLSKRKAAIYNLFANVKYDDAESSEKQIFDQSIVKIIDQNEILEEKIMFFQKKLKNALRSTVEKKFQFRGYLLANNLNVSKFAGKA